MARVTVEDCLKNVKNRFELVTIAAKRARQLMRGKEAKVEWDNDKATVVALREIAAGHTTFTETERVETDDIHVIHTHTISTETQEITFAATPNESEQPKASESEQE